MKLRDRIKHEYHDSILSSKLTIEVTDRVSEQDVGTAINTNVKRMWARFYWDIHEQVGAMLRQIESLPEDEVSSGVAVLYDDLGSLLRAIEQYKE